jgi:hypothetical protein
MALAVATKAPDAAAWAAKLYQLNPADDQMFVDIMDSYQAQGQWAEAEPFSAVRCLKHRLSPPPRDYCISTWPFSICSCSDRRRRGRISWPLKPNCVK